MIHCLTTIHCLLQRAYRWNISIVCACVCECVSVCVYVHAFMSIYVVTRHWYNHFHSFRSIGMIDRHNHQYYPHLYVILCQLKDEWLVWGAESGRSENVRMRRWAWMTGMECWVSLVWQGERVGLPNQGTQFKSHWVDCQPHDTHVLVIELPLRSYNGHCGRVMDPFQPLETAHMLFALTPKVNSCLSCQSVPCWPRAQDTEREIPLLSLCWVSHSDIDTV